MGSKNYVVDDTPSDCTVISVSDAPEIQTTSIKMGLRQFVVRKDGCYETVDGGKHWQEFKVASHCPVCGMPKSELTGPLLDALPV